MDGNSGAAPRRVRQPGPPRPERACVVRAGAVRIERELPAGTRLLDALAALMADGVESACLGLRGGALGPFAYVIPALSPDSSRAAFYSATSRPPGATRLEAGAVTLGWRDGQPFFHCHAVWQEADGTRGCGHVLPEETVVAAPVRVEGAGLVGARFEVTPDAETGFSLFMPRASGAPVPPAARPAAALRLAPNQDLSAALERVAQEAGFARARVQGGVASIIEARFTDAPPLQGFATEMLVRRGVVGEGATALDVAVVDYRGAIREGRLVHGDNPVLMTFEGALELE